MSYSQSFKYLKMHISIPFDLFLSFRKITDFFSCSRAIFLPQKKFGLFPYLGVSLCIIIKFFFSVDCIKKIFLTALENSVVFLHFISGHCRKLAKF